MRNMFGISALYSVEYNKSIVYYIIIMSNKVESISKKFGKRVKIERIKQDISQERLAELSDLHRSTLGLIENGKISPTLDSIAKIAGALGVSLSEIVDFDF